MVSAVRRVVGAFREALDRFRVGFGVQPFALRLVALLSFSLVLKLVSEVGLFVKMEASGDSPESFIVSAVICLKNSSKSLQLDTLSDMGSLWTLLRPLGFLYSFTLSC